MKFILLVFIFLGLTIFLYSQNIESKYFNLICQEPCNLTELAQKLNVNYFLHLDGLTKTSNNLEDIIANSLDALYLEVCDILDIHIYSYKGKIKVFSNKEKMKKTLISFNIKDLDIASIYIPSQNTIYVSLADLNLGVLSHEIAHIIISKYFIVPPSSKVQEILSGYVEYSIRKKLGILPEKH